LIRASGVPYALLRNTFYSEFIADQIGSALEHGALLTAAGAGRLATAARADLAEAAAVVLSGEGHRNAVYELTGAAAWTYDDLAAAVSRLSGRQIVHASVSDAELAATLAGAGLPAPVVELLGGIHRGIREGALARVSPDLGRLLGRAPLTIEQTIAQFLPAAQTA
ncbi:MAG TPA: hypothetical protein VD886_04100, partial [Herpetosiphonaceae bacterium]|nr:hypothetical protein [Herpetosiphonaceae bacterium]